MMNKVVIISSIILALLLGVFSGYRYEKLKLDRIVGARDIMYTKQITDLQNANAQLEKGSLLGRDHYTMQGDKLMFVSSDSTVSSKDIVLDDGTKLSIDGILTKKDGTRQTLNNGQSVWMNGILLGADGSLTQVNQ